MNLAFFIARKYFLSKKKKNFINVISIISMVGVAVGTMSLIVGLSFFNGLGEVLRGLYSSFDPQLKVEAVKGKSFVVTDSLLRAVGAVPGVRIVTEVVEDNALAMYNDTQLVVKLKGVGSNFISQHRLDKHIVQGELILHKDNAPRAILGRGVQYALSISASNDFYALQLYYPKNISPGALNPGSYYNQQNILPAGFFQIEKQYDENYIFVPLDFAVSLMDYGNKRTALEIQLEEGSAVAEVKQQLNEQLGPAFRILTNEEQHSDLFKILKWEKLFVFITFSFIVAVASFNIFFSLTMLAIEKKKDVSVLYALGATDGLIRRIFLAEGALIGITGAALGLALGMGISYIQQQYGVVSMGMQTSIIDAYPVVIKTFDVVFTAGSAVFITLLASYRPAYLAARAKSLSEL